MNPDGLVQHQLWLGYYVRVGQIMQSVAVALDHCGRCPNCRFLLPYVMAMAAQLNRMGASILSILNDPSTPRRFGARCMFY